MRARYQTASATVALLLLLALVASISGTVFFFISVSQRIQSREVQFLKEQEEDASTLIDEFGSQTAAAGQVCLGGKSSVEGICFIRGKIPPLSSMMTGATKCNAPEETTDSRTPSGFLLSKQAVLFPYSCKIEEEATFTELKVDGNLVASPRLSSMPSLTGTPAILFSSGYMEIAGDLIANSDLLIVAGGDIKIAALKNDGLNPQRVTIISFSGSVILDAVYGNLRLNVQAPLDVFLPQGVTSGENSLDINWRSLWPLGFSSD